MTQQAIKTSRFAAIETLNRLQRTRYPVKPLFETVAEECLLRGPERGLAMKLIYGVLRQREYLDLLINTLCQRPVNKLDPFIYCALSVGLYQLYCLDRIPESAAVNETVNAVKAAGLKKHLQGFVNGVLRNAIRKRETLPLPSAPANLGTPLLNHPKWLTKRWKNRFGDEEMERICQNNNEEPQLVLRINRNTTSPQQLRELFAGEEIASHPGKYAPDSLILPDYQGSITSLPGFDKGYFQIQDEAAQLAVLLLGPLIKKGHYLDACAGLGGKTSYIMQLLDPESRVVAIEPEPQRQRLLVENIDRLFSNRQLTICKSTLQDYCRTARLQFDGVFVDAPCSGTGVTGRHPDIRWNRRPNDFMRYQQTQQELLEKASELVLPGGILVYATCSLEVEENQEVVEDFLTRHTNFVSTSCSDYLPPEANIFTEGDYFCPRPNISMDGFFAARLQRTL